MGRDAGAGSDERSHASHDCSARSMWKRALDNEPVGHLRGRSEKSRIILRSPSSGVGHTRVAAHVSVAVTCGNTNVTRRANDVITSMLCDE